MNEHFASEILHSNLYIIQISLGFNSDAGKMQTMGSRLTCLLLIKNMKLSNERGSVRLSVLIEIAAVGTGDFISRDLVWLTEL